MLQQNLLSFALMGSEWVLWLLVALSVLCVAVALERLVHAILNRTPRDRLREALHRFATTADAAALGRECADLRGAEARVLRAGMEYAGRGAASMEAAMDSATTRERLRMERGLVILGTTGANAPFVGLFGTVLGIIKAFHDLALNQAEAASAVMAGISEALVATAIGLMVAIPAVIIYNTFQRYNRNALSEIEALNHLVLARFRGRAPGDDPDANAQGEA